MSLVDREAEMRTLGAAIRRAGQREGNVTVVRGALGIGRSALLSEAAEQAAASGVVVLPACASPLERASPYGVVRQIFEPLITSAPAVVDTAGAARPLFASDEARTPEPTRAVLAGLSDLLAAAIGDEPVVITVDDLQWADEPSLRWLSFLARRIAATPAALLFAVHDGLPAVEEPAIQDILAEATLVRPRPLGPAGSARMIEELAGEHPEPAFVQACRKRFG